MHGTVFVDVFIYLFIYGLFNDIRRFDCVALNMWIIVHIEFENRWKKVAWSQFKAFVWGGQKKTT